MDEKRAEKINNLLSKAVKKKVFSCAAYAFSKRGTTAYDREMQYYGYDGNTAAKKKLTKDHFFDLASLTKPFVTIPLLLALFEKNSVYPETPLRDIFSDCPIDKTGITLQQLMSHSAGFTPHREYFIELKKIPEKIKKEFLLHKILEEKLCAEPGKKQRYSDLGFILLGLIIEKVTGEELDSLVRNSIYDPLHLQNDLIFPKVLEKNTHTYVSTEKCLHGENSLSGIVHDDNCRAIGGVAGHAGIFGTLQGVIQFCEHLLEQWQGREHHPAYSNALLQRALQRVGNSSRTMGFDMVAGKGSSAGNFFSEKSVGHLGFTGTSFWIDPQKECIVVLLTNRVYYGWENWKIKEFRPVFHDLLMKS